MRIISHPSEVYDVELAYEHDHAPENDRSACMKVHVKKLVDHEITEDKAARTILSILREKHVPQEDLPTLSALRKYIKNNRLRVLGAGVVKRMDQLLVEAQKLNLLKMAFDDPELAPDTVGYIYVVDDTYLNEHNVLVPIPNVELCNDLHVSISPASIPEDLLRLKGVIQTYKGCDINRLDRTGTGLIHLVDNTYIHASLMAPTFPPVQMWSRSEMELELTRCTREALQACGGSIKEQLLAALEHPNIAWSNSRAAYQRSIVVAELSSEARTFHKKLTYFASLVYIYLESVMSALDIA